jgi:hypothetical protein
MIVRPHPQGLLCVGQASHAWVAGQLARAWGNASFAAPDPFEEVCLGAEQHDVGMAEYDLKPELDPETGGPRDFMNMPLATHLRLWSEAPRKLLTQSPFAALTCSLHGHALYDHEDTLEPGSEDSRAVARFVAEQEAFQRELARALDLHPDTLTHTQKLVWAVDFFSLSLFMDWDPDTVDAPTAPGADLEEIRVRKQGDSTLYVDPWPFATREIRVVAAGRILGSRSKTEDELHAALDAAPWVSLPFELRPGS